MKESKREKGRGGDGWRKRMIIEKKRWRENRHKQEKERKSEDGDEERNRERNRKESEKA